MKFSLTLALVAASVHALEAESFPAHEAPSQKCPDLEHLVDLDTPEYQAKTAWCKQ